MARPLSSEVSKALGFSFNTNLAKNLQWYRTAVLKQDFDCAIIVDGPEGSGKSVLGMQIAYFLDKEHSIDIEKQICYYPEQFQEAVMSLEKGKAIVWDEARRGLNRRRSGDNVNLEITDLLAECRQHNLFLVIIMPSFYDMDLNVAIWRTRALIHVWYTWDTTKPEAPLNRGFFRFYTEEGKKALYTNKLMRIKYAYPHLSNMSFDATFTHHYVVDEEEYRRKKRVAEEAYRRKDKRTSKNNAAVVLEKLKQQGLLKPKALISASKIMGVSERTLQRWRQDDDPRINL